ncbi:MAG: BMP family ABC transporter substrate-binding protein, partial [Roseibium sp.]
MKNILKATVAAVAFAAASSAATAADIKACFVYIGPVGDFGWTYQHDQGRLDVVEKFGDRVETAYLENVPEGPDSERAIERFARDGCNIIFTTSFGYMNPTLKVAKKYPNVMFEHATGYKT